MFLQKFGKTSEKLHKSLLPTVFWFFRSKYVTTACVAGGSVVAEHKRSRAAKLEEGWGLLALLEMPHALQQQNHKLSRLM